jgi:hypothetical protein
MMPVRDLLHRIEQVPVLLSRGVIAIAGNNFRESISCAPRNLSARNMARIGSADWPQK